MTYKECIIVAGPTAVGKTAEAIRLAKLYTTSIISADSRQCYKELNIGVARPTEDELKEVNHYFIANHSVSENITAASFAKEARGYLNEIFKDCDKAIVCGGTGLYIKALVEGLDEIPPIPKEIREQVIQLYKENGIDALRSELVKHDPSFPHHGDINNPQRMMRALEVVLFSGRSIFEYHTAVDSSPLTVNRQQSTVNSQQIIFTYKILDLPREDLYNRINRRVDKMIEDGLEDEVRSLVVYKNLSSLQTVGYKEFFEYFDGNYTKEEAIEKIKQHTRNYAKRQVTWFKKYKVNS